jgi:hypothetical protein
MRGLKPITKIPFVVSVRSPFLQMSILGWVPRCFLLTVPSHCLFGEKRRKNYSLYEALRNFIASRNEFL